MFVDWRETFTMNQSMIFHDELKQILSCLILTYLYLSTPLVEIFSASKTSSVSSIRQSKINAAGCAQLVFQMLTLQTKVLSQLFLSNATYQVLPIQFVWKCYDYYMLECNDLFSKCLDKSNSWTWECHFIFRMGLIICLSLPRPHIFVSRKV